MSIPWDFIQAVKDMAASFKEIAEAIKYAANVIAQAVAYKDSSK